MSIVPIQCRLGRVALGWGIRDLARIAEVATYTINRFEQGEELLPATVDKLQHALERAGVEFIHENGGGPGIRLSGKTDGSRVRLRGKTEMKRDVSL